MSRGARLDKGDNSEITSIMLAASGGHESCLEILLNAAAITDASRNTINNTDDDRDPDSNRTVALSQINATDVDGNNASHYACRAGEAGALALLADAGASLDLLPSAGVDSTEAGTSKALRPAQLAVFYGFLFCLEELAARGVDLEALDGDGDTLLTLSVQCGSEACAEFLLTGGVSSNGGGPLVDPNRPGRGGERPLNAAARRGRLPFMSLLLKSGASPAAQGADGDSTVHAAARCGQVGAIEVLAQEAPAVDGGDSAGFENDSKAEKEQGRLLPSWWFLTTSASETATFIAAREGHVGVCRALQAIGALEPSRSNADGVTPMVVAALMGHPEVNRVFQFAHLYF